MVLYFLKAFEADLKGNPNLINVKCCTQSSPILSLFVYHFYKISETSPLAGLSIVHIYNWILENQTSYKTQEIIKLIGRLK